MEYALITGASSGFGYQFALELAKTYSYNLIIVARRKERLELLQKEVNVDVKIFESDLSISKNCFYLFDQIKELDIRVFINNAGFGLAGEFKESDLEKELKMIDLNVKAVHILTKLFIQYYDDNISRNLVNISSLAGLVEGPYMATYYATKNYVRVLSASISNELKNNNSKIKISCICPGPVNTEFNDTANVKFTGPLSNKKFAVTDEYVAKYGLKKAFKGKLIIIPGIKEKLEHNISKIVPNKTTRFFISKYQKRKF